MVCAHGTNHARDVMILFKPGPDVDIIDTYKDYIGRVLFVEAKIQDTIQITKYLLPQIVRPARFTFIIMSEML